MTTRSASESESEELLSIDDIVGSEDTQYKTVSIPEWPDKNGKPGKVRLGSLNAEQMMVWIETNDGPAKKTAGIRLLIQSLVDKDGKRIGTDKHLESFKKKSQRVLVRLIDEVLKLNGMREEDREKAKNDLSEAPTGASPTDLPSSSENTTLTPSAAA